MIYPLPSVTLCVSRVHEDDVRRPMRRMNSDVVVNAGRVNRMQPRPMDSVLMRFHVMRQKAADDVNDCVAFSRVST